MYEYKTETITLKYKWIEGEYVKEEDLKIMDEAFNLNQKDGWELVTYDYLTSDRKIKDQTVILATFRRKK